VGYRFMQRLAAEAHLEFLPRSDLDGDTFRFTTHITRLEALTLTADVKGYLLTGMIQPFGIVGFGWMKVSGKDVRSDPADRCKKGTAGGEKNKDCRLPLEDAIETDDNGFVGRFGGGVDVYVTRNVSLGIAASYVLPIASWDGEFDYNYISIDWGIQYRF
jgi:opacity protein-like surface antigen